MQLHDMLEWFVANVESQLVDRKLREEKIELQFYWDTEHVMRAVLGMADFYEDGEFQPDDFEDTKTLVVCLAAANWFGPLHLLFPHRAEFYYAFKSGFNVGADLIPVGGSERFFRNCGLDNMPSLDDFRREQPDEQARIVNQYAGKARQLFKAVNCANGSWRERLTAMYVGGLLKLDPIDEVDYSELFEDPVFIKARDFFDARRPNLRGTPNNITDATALCLLLRQVEAFESGQERKLPRFFESSPLFREAATTLGDQPKETLANVFRNADYYFFRAMFVPPKDFAGNERHDKFLSALISAKDKVKKILKPSDPLGTSITELVNEITI